MLNPCGWEIHCLGEEAAPVLSPKPPTCCHSAVVASAAKGQLSLGSLNPKRRSVERVGAARTARAGKEAGRPFRPRSRKRSSGKPERPDSLQRHVKAA